MATPHASSAGARPRVVLAKRGDVLLKLGNANDETTSELVVSSNTLSMASPVFDAMFNSGFAEGQNLSSASPRAISLPEDDPFYMTILCNILHFKTSAVPVRLESIQLINFTVLCDKYDCVEAVQTSCRIWIADLTHNADIWNLERLLFSTYLLDLPKEFSLVTRIIIQETADPMSAGGPLPGRDLLPLVIIDRIQQDRKARLSQIIAFLTPQSVQGKVNRVFSRKDYESYFSVTSCHVSRKEVGEL
ncbi:hypothetical protein BCR34DRAFT_603984 [Clohesyomyces aquaticus]|uniref:BTB domain-containing protein n=1 Tax=Clohesyomyces aquaticus TaxID=1231657 RepID=A0A1Y1ZAN1_9PLEO|nr:hypothetical protein BCR34DRAFT_603984 [Clohesyomyces aquaticus]